MATTKAAVKAVVKPATKFSKTQPIIISVPPKMNLIQSQNVLKDVMTLVGCPGCYSGFDIRFNVEKEILNPRIAVGKDLQVSAR